MKKLSIGIVALIALALVCGGIGFVWWNSSLQSRSDTDAKIRVVIPKGRSAEAIGKQLEEEEIIKSSLAFKIYVQVYGKQGNVNSGEFTLSPSMTIPEILEVMGKGPEEVWVTVPEGLRREEVVEKVIEGVGYAGPVAADFRTEFLDLTMDDEGYLFPDTYLLPFDVTAQQVVTLMTTTFASRFGALEEKMEAKGLSLEETVILASILEKETKTDTERPVIAGIYFNRLDIDMPIQADATVQYVLGTNRCSGKVDCDWWNPPTRAELQIDSRFNTYKYAGLPPAPIANPGLSSLKAVVESQKTPYYYYIHEPDGTVHYAETLDEHNANVARYLR